MKFDFIEVSDKKLRSIAAGAKELSMGDTFAEVAQRSLVVAYDDDCPNCYRIGFAVGVTYGYTTDLKTHQRKVYVLDPVDGTVVYYDHIVPVSSIDCPEVIVDRGDDSTNYNIAKVLGLNEDLTRFRVILKHIGETDEIPLDKVQFIDNVKIGVVKED